MYRRRSRKRRSRNRNKYLGRRCVSPPCVKDRGRKGLDTATEYRDIIRAILRDYRKGRITKKTARGRLLLLYRLTYPKYNSKARRISPHTRNKLRGEIRRALRRL